MLSKVLLLLATVVVFATAQSGPPPPLKGEPSIRPVPTRVPPSPTPPPTTRRPAPTTLPLPKKDPPPHTLAKPKTWKLGATETLSLTIYDWNQRSRFIDATLYVRRCTCVHRPLFQRRCMDDEIFSSTQVQARPGKAALLHIKLPDHDEVPDGQFFLTIKSTLGEIFVDKQNIFFSSNSRGMIVVRTDKPIYKPSQTIKFCVVTLDATARPRPADVSVRIQDPRSRKIEEWKSVEVPDNGYKCLELELSDEPPLGTWRISITENVRRGSCNNFYGSLSGSCDFKVDTFVLPRFEVNVTAPEYIHRSTATIKGSVSADYVFGEPVEGTVTIKFTLEARARRESFDFHTITAKLKNGKVDFSVPAEEYMRILRYRFDPFCVSSSIKVFAEVEEKGRGTKFNDTASVPLVANRVSFSFDEKMPRMFRAGMEYPVMIKSLLPDGSPAASKKFRLSVTANNGDLSINTKINKVLSTDKKGEWMRTFKIPSGANCLKILVRPVVEEDSCENINICLTPVAVFSPSSTYLQLTASNMEPKIGDTFKATATSNKNFEHLQCMVIARGRLLSHQSVDSTDSSAAVEVVVSAQHAPRFQVVCYIAQEDGEIVGDVLEIETVCSLEHKVAMKFHRDNDRAIVDEENSVVPMTEVYVNVTSTPNTPVLVSVFDKSLSLLAGSCDIGKKSSVCRRLDSIAFGTITNIDHSCFAETRTQCCPSECQEPQKVDIKRIINSLGINIMTNMYLPSAPVTATVRPPPGLGGPDFLPTTTDDVAFREVALDEDTSGSDEAVRRFFPESWLFEVIETGSDGLGKLPSTAPDTITTWVGQAVALSKEEGIGFSDQASLKVFKSFFVSLELPFSVNFGERVVIKPVVFNYLSESVRVNLTIDLHDDLSLLNQAPDPLTIQAESSNSFELRILTRAIGQLPIRITAEIVAMKMRDAVEKPLFVKPGCVRYEKTNTLLAKGNGQVTFDFELPTCVVPGSQKASITVTGDLMSPPNLDNLLVVPSGCGEQNLVKTTNNFVVANYLDATEQLMGAIAARVRANIMKGYQRQLNYQLFTGAFAIWPSGRPSVWLTAFALGSFSEMAHFYGDASFIDEGVMSAAFNYLMKKQNKSGCFKLEGAVHNYRLLNDEIPITAYVLNSLISYEMISSDNARLEHSIENATRCLVNYTRSNSDDICTYTLALTSYALAQTRDRNRNNVITQLKKEIKTSVDYPGTCYVCNSCTVRGNGQMGQQCEGESPRRDPITSDCVETTAYTLLALLEARDTDRTGCLAQWLIKQQNSFGSFGSSQDTIIGLKALAAFSRHTFTPEINMTFRVETNAQTDNIMIVNENRYMRHEVMVSKIPGSTDVYWSGEGTALVQSVFSYHGCDCCNSSDCFELSLNPVRAPVNALAMETCFSYQCGKRSNMAILDVQIPTGCIPGEHTVTRGEVALRRGDVTGDNAVLYLAEVTSKTACIKFQCEKKFEVENRKPLAVTIYDYYMPTERVTKFLSFE